MLGKYNVAPAMIGSFAFGAMALEKIPAIGRNYVRKLAKEKF